MAKRKSVENLESDIHTFITDDDLTTAMTVLRDGMKAKHMVRGPRQGGMVDYVETPDNSCRFRSAQLLMHYKFGQPASRTEITMKGGQESTSLTPQQLMARFTENGVDVHHILQSYAGALKTANDNDFERMEGDAPASDVDDPPKPLKEPPPGYLKGETSTPLGLPPPENQQNPENPQPPT